MQTILESLHYQPHGGTPFFLFSSSQLLNGSITPLLITKDCESDTSLLDADFLMMLLRQCQTISWIKGFSFPMDEKIQKEAADLLRATRYNSRTLRRLELFSWNDHLESFIFEHTQCLERFTIYSLDTSDVGQFVAPPYERLFKHLAPTLTKLQLHNIEKNAFSNEDFIHIRHLSHLEFLELGSVAGFTGEGSEEVFLNLSKSLKSLIIRGCDEISDVSGFGCLTLLNEFEFAIDEFDETKFAKQIAENWNFPHLQTCQLQLGKYFGDRPIFDESFDFLLSCNRLRILSIHSCGFRGNNAESFHNVFTINKHNTAFLQTLVSLTFQRCVFDQVPVLNAIAALQNLQSISFVAGMFFSSSRDRGTSNNNNNILPWSCGETLREFRCGSKGLNTLHFLLPCKQLDTLSFTDCNIVSGNTTDDDDDGSSINVNIIMRQLVLLVEQNCKSLKAFSWTHSDIDNDERVVDEIFATQNRPEAFFQSLESVTVKGSKIKSSILKDIARLAPRLKELVLFVLSLKNCDKVVQEDLLLFEDLRFLKIRGVNEFNDEVKSKHPNLVWR